MIKNKVILKTVSLFLSFWMLLASSGLSIDFHYCEGELVDWSLFDNHSECDHVKKEVIQESCCESTSTIEYHDQSTEQIKKENCCSSGEAHVNIEAQFNLVAQEVEFTIPQLIYSYSIIESGFSIEEEINYLLDGKVPPILPKKELSFIQVFLL